MVKRLVLFLILSMFVVNASAKDRVFDSVDIHNVNVNRVKTTLNISYDISLGDNVRSCNVRLLISLDGGNTFSPLSNKYLSGDIGQITVSGLKSIKYDVEFEKDKLAGKQLAFKVEVTSKDVLKTETVITGQVAVYPHLSYGIMFGMVKKWGWYAKLRSDFTFPKSSYDCISTEGSFWGTGEKQISRLNITAGAMVRATKWLYPYFGAGYGSYGLYWKDISGNWAKVSDYSTSGVSLDAGVAFKIGKVSITAGVSNTMFKYTEAEVGVGVMF